MPRPGPQQHTTEWYALHASGECVTASRAAAACGVGDHDTQFDLALELLGRKDPKDQNDYMARGLLFEPFLRAEAERQTGRKITGDLPLYFSDDYPYIAASPDGVYEDDETVGWSGKCCDGRRRGRMLGESGSDDIFTDWLMQSQQEMLVMGWRQVDVFVMLGLHEYRTYPIERNEALIERLVAKETELLDMLARGELPEPDWRHPHTPRLIKDLFRLDNDQAVPLSDETMGVVLEYHRLGDEAARVKAERAVAQAKILHALGDAAIGVYPQGNRCLVRKLVHRPAYTTKPTSYVRLMEKDA